MTGLCARSVGSNPPLSSGKAISGPGRKRGTREGEQNAAGRKREKGRLWCTGDGKRWKELEWLSDAK